MIVNNHSPETTSLEELAQRLGIGLTLAYRLAREDKLPVPTIRIGRKFVFSNYKIDELLGKPDLPEPKG